MYLTSKPNKCGIVLKAIIRAHSRVAGAGVAIKVAPVSPPCRTVTAHYAVPRRCGCLLSLLSVCKAWVGVGQPRFARATNY